MVQRHFLGTEEHLGRAQHQGVITIIQHVAQDDLHQLVQKNGRKVQALPHDRKIRRLQCGMSHEMISPGDHEFPILARIVVGDRRELPRCDRPSWIVQHCLVQGSFGRASGGRRRHLRSGQVDHQEFVREHQVSVRVAVEQVMTAGKPEVAHVAQRRSPSRSAARSIGSRAGGASSATWIKLNTGAGFGRPFDCNVRNASRVTPSSYRRDTAINIPAG